MVVNQWWYSDKDQKQNDEIKQKMFMINKNICEIINEIGGRDLESIFSKADRYGE